MASDIPSSPFVIAACQSSSSFLCNAMHTTHHVTLHASSEDASSHLHVCRPPVHELERWRQHIPGNDCQGIHGLTQRAGAWSLHKSRICQKDCAPSCGPAYTQHRMQICTCQSFQVGIQEKGSALMQDKTVSVNLKAGGQYRGSYSISP